MIVQIKGSDVLLGMNWQAKELPEKPELPGDAMYQIQFKAHNRIYMGSTSEAVKSKRCYSAAAWFARSVAEPTLLIWGLGDDLYWLMVADPRGLDYQTDYVGDIDDVLSVYRDIIDDYDELTQLVYSADELIERNYIRGGKSTDDVEDLFSGSIPRDLRIKAVKRKNVPITWVLGALGSLLLIGAASTWYILDQEAKELERLRKAAAARQTPPAPPDYDSLREARIAEAVYQSLSRDLAVIHPDDLINACRQAVQAVGLSNGSWSFEKASCNTEQLRVTWKRKPGDLSTIHSLNPIGSISAAVDGKSIQETIKHKDLTDELVKRETPDRAALPDYVAMTEDFLFELQKSEWSGLKYTLSQASVKSIPYEDPDPNFTNSPGAEQSQVPATEAYQEGSWTLKGHDLWSLSRSFDRKWLKVTAVEFKQSQGRIAWDMKGNYYTQ